ncbi:MAG: SDR family NAD(P)-dependent oxidoreductase, partial [Gemmatimonadaceae bacterium]
MNGITGKNALVTGGSSGIGQAIAVRFGREGANVAINYRRDEADAEETAALIEAEVDRCIREVRECGGATVLVQADVSKATEVASMVRETVEALGGLDILVNNAGIQVAGESHEIDVDDFDRVVAVNLRGAFLCAREAIRHWLAEGRPGVIVNISSVHQIIPKPRFVGYSASKGGM